MPNLQTVVGDQGLLGCNCRSVCKQAIDHIDVASNERQRALDAAGYVQLGFRNSDADSAVLSDKQLRRSNWHRKLGP